jgi:ankyrin repeat protein
MEQYLENVREIERRIQRAERARATADLELPSRPPACPFDFEEHVRLMYDLMTLAYQANVTRVITFMVSREVSNRTYTQVGVTDGHHAISHHQNRAEKMAKNVLIQTFNVNMFGEFLTKLKATPDGDGSLLDHVVLLYGSNMSNSNAHDHFPLPNLVAGGGAGTLRGGRHLRYPDHTPMTNLLVSMLDKPASSTRRSATAPDRWRIFRDGPPEGGPYEERTRCAPASRRSLLSCLQDRPSHRRAAPAAAPSGAKLVAAVKAGESAAVLSMLQRKADPNAAEVDGTTALHWAGAQRRRDARGSTAARRRQAGGGQPLRRDAAAARLRTGRPRLSSSACSRPASAPTSPDRWAKPALHTCARTGHVAAAKVLVTHGASLNAIESWRGQTPIMWAAEQGHAEMVSMLAEAGADVNARSGIIAWERQRSSEPRDKWLPPGGFTPICSPRAKGASTPPRRSSPRAPTSAPSIRTVSPRWLSRSSTVTSTSPTCSSSTART